MSKIPRRGSTALQFVVEEAMPGHNGWRPLVELGDQREAIAAMDAAPSSYAQRVVLVMAVRIPPHQAAPAVELAELRRADRLNQRPGSAQLDFPRPRGATP